MAADTACMDLCLIHSSPSCTFLAQANLLGLPAISVPVGHDASGLPIGLQFIGRPWTEATLLRLGAAVEASRREEVHRHRAPELWVNPLTGESSMGAANL